MCYSITHTVWLKNNGCKTLCTHTVNRERAHMALLSGTHENHFTALATPAVIWDKRQFLWKHPDTLCWIKSPKPEVMKKKKSIEKVNSGVWTGSEDWDWMWMTVMLWTYKQYYKSHLGSWQCTDRVTHRRIHWTQGIFNHQIICYTIIIAHQKYR